VPVSPYIKRLREVIGTDLIFVPAVTTIVSDADDRVLLVYETDADGWSTPGGALEVDERPEAGARREVFEETGLTIRIDGIETVLGGPEFHAHYKNGDEVAYVTTVYRGTVESGSGESAPDGVEVTAAEWFALDQLSTVPLSNFATQLFRHLGWL